LFKYDHCLFIYPPFQKDIIMVREVVRDTRQLLAHPLFYETYKSAWVMVQNKVHALQDKHRAYLDECLADARKVLAS